MIYSYPIEIPKKESIEIKLPSFRNVRYIPSNITFKTSVVDDQIEIKITHGNNTVLNVLSNYFYLNNEINLNNLVNFYNNDAPLMITIKNNSRDYFRNTLIVNHREIDFSELPIIVSQKIQKSDFKTCLKSLTNYSRIEEIYFIIKVGDLGSDFDLNTLEMSIKAPFETDLPNSLYFNVTKQASYAHKEYILCFNFEFGFIPDVSIFEHLIVSTSVDLGSDININYLVRGL